MRKLWVLLIAALVAALIAAGCGSDGDETVESDERPREANDDTEDRDDASTDTSAREPRGLPQVLANAAETTTDARTGRFEMVMDMSGLPELDQPIQLTGAGAFDAEAGVATMTLNMDALVDAAAQASGDPQQAEMLRQLFGEGGFEVISEGTSIYVRMPFLSQMLGSDKPWLKMENEALAQSGGLAPGMNSFGSGDPSKLLEALRGVSGDVREVGEEDVRGTATTRYAGTVDIQKAISAAPPAQRERVEQALSQLGGEGKVPFDVWVGDDDDLVRRLRYDMSRMFGSTAPGATVIMTIDFLDFGIDVDVAVPPADQVFDATEQMRQMAGTGAQG